MKIDFKLLTQQKETLINIISRLQGEHEVCEDLDGILHLLDALEDENNPINSENENS